MTAATTRPGPDGVTTTLTVSGLHCAGCAQRVEGVLAAIPGVTASVDLAAGAAEVHHPSAVSVDALVAAVRDAGYTVEPVRR